MLVLGSVSGAVVFRFVLIQPLLEFLCWIGEEHI